MYWGVHVTQRAHMFIILIVIHKHTQKMCWSSRSTACATTHYFNILSKLFFFGCFVTYTWHCWCWLLAAVMLLKLHISLSIAYITNIQSGQMMVFTPPIIFIHAYAFIVVRKDYRSNVLKMNKTPASFAFVYKDKANIHFTHLFSHSRSSVQSFNGNFSIN